MLYRQNFLRVYVSEILLLLAIAWQRDNTSDSVCPLLHSSMTSTMSGYFPMLAAEAIALE